MGAGWVKKEKFPPVFFFLVRAFSIPLARLSRSMEQAIFSSVLYLKIIVTNVLYCCTVNLSRHNYFLANKNLLFYRCLFVYIIKRTLHSGLKMWILFSRFKNNISLTHCARSPNIVLPLENIIHIFAPPCNILYIYSSFGGARTFVHLLAIRNKVEPLVSYHQSEKIKRTLMRIEGHVESPASRAWSGVPRSTNCLTFSIAWGRLKISRWPFHLCTIFVAYLIIRFSKV